MWAGNVPGDTTENEIRAFFTSKPGPPGSTEGAGVESIHIIPRSNCAFVNFVSEAHLLFAISTINGKPLRPHDRKCKPLLCRVRQREDDAKSGVGAQRTSGIHKAYVKQKQDQEQQAAKASASAGEEDVGNTSSDASRGESGGEPESGDSSHSSSSSLFARHFPKRFFILKAHNVDDLEESVKNCWWSTQQHNERVLDQAYRTARDGVYIFFSANKSGQWFGYARMDGPILPPSADVDVDGTSSPTTQQPQPTSTLSPPPAQSAQPDSPASATAPGRPFRVRWIKTQKIPFQRTRHVINAFNSNREVKISRDGTEVNAESGEELMATWHIHQPSQPPPVPVPSTTSGSSGSTIATMSSLHSTFSGRSGPTSR